MITLLQEIWGVVVALWNTGNRWVRWAIAIIASWPLLMIYFSISPASALVPYTALLPLFAVILLFIAWLDPLVVVAIAAFPKGRTVLKWLAGIIAVELIIGIYLSVVPVINNPALVPLLILIVAAMVFLFISPIKNKWTKRILYALVVIITLSFFFPNIMKAIREKGEKWDKKTAVSLLEEEPKRLLTPPRAAVAEKPICDGPAIYKFDGKNEIQIPIRPNCWSGWVDVPSDATFYKIDSGSDGWHERWQWNGQKFYAGKDTASWRPMRRIENGTFRLRGENPAGETAKIIIERRV